MKTWTIYKITSPSNKIYIGQSKNLQTRLNNYKNLRCKKQPKLYNSIKKYGWSYHLFEIIEENIISLQISNEKEIYWIKFYDCVKNGLNCKPGGTGNCPSLPETVRKKIGDASKKRWDSGEMQGMRGKKHSDESNKKREKTKALLPYSYTDEIKKKIKIAYHARTERQKQTYLDAMHARKGYLHSEETKKKISKSHKERIENGYIISEETRKKLSKSNKNYKPTEETKKKISIANKDRKHSDESKENMSKAHIRYKVKCLNNGVIYESAKNAALELNLKKSASINAVCNGTRKSIYGYLFIYVN